jgi:hypothetical protein
MQDTAIQVIDQYLDHTDLLHGVLPAHLEEVMVPPWSRELIVVMCQGADHRQMDTMARAATQTGGRHQGKIVQDLVSGFSH